MKKRIGWTRREFVKQAGLASLVAAANPLRASASSGVKVSVPCFAYVGSAEGSISVFAAGSAEWKQVQEIAAAKPSALVLHPGKDVLYVVNEIDLFEHLPAGSVEAYTIHKDGHLALLNRQPLSLSAILPRHAAVSPNGRTLVVAVHGGGAYNALRIREDGSLARVSAIWKDTGFGPDEEHPRTAHPQTVVFDRMGHLLSADMGTDRLNIFRLEEDRLSVLMRRYTQTGSGPRQVELHPCGNLLFVANALGRSIISYGYDSRNGKILESLCHVSCNFSGSAAMTMHPSGDFLYTASSFPHPIVTAWRINATDGSLKRVHEEQTSNSVHTLMATPDGNSLLALGRSAGAMTRWQLDVHRRPINSQEVASVRQPVSIAVKHV